MKRIKKIYVVEYYMNYEGGSSLTAFSAKEKALEEVEFSIKIKSDKFLKLERCSAGTLGIWSNGQVSIELKEVDVK